MSWCLGCNWSIQGLPIHSHIYNTSVNTIQAINVCVCVFVGAPVCLCVCVTQDQVSFGGHYFSTLIQPSCVAPPPPSKSNLNPSQPFSCLLWSGVLLFFPHLSPHVLLPTVNCNVYPLFFGFIPLLQAVPWVPKGDRQRMRTLIVTPARAKPCIFNLLWHYSPSLSLTLSLSLPLSLPPSLFLSSYLSPWASCLPATAWFTPSRDISPGTRKPRCPICPWCLCPALCVCV